MRQIGIAMNAYHSVHNVFPPGHMVPRRGSGILDAYSEITFCLPQLDQNALYSSINFSFNSIESLDFPTQENHTARNTKLSFFLCPSDGESKHLNSYRFNRGRWGVLQVGYYDGPFIWPLLPSHASVTDGLSRTAFVSDAWAGASRPKRAGPET